VTKWAVALNVALATAIVAINRQPAANLLAELCVVVVILATALLLYITKRMTGARNDALRVYKFLMSKGVDCAEISGKDTLSERTWRHDLGELVLYVVILSVSCLPAIVASQDYSVTSSKRAHIGELVAFQRSGIGSKPVSQDHERASWPNTASPTRPLRAQPPTTSVTCSARTTRGEGRKMSDDPRAPTAATSTPNLSAGVRIEGSYPIFASRAQRHVVENCVDTAE
jgi:hypothetical protein